MTKHVHAIAERPVVFAVDVSPPAGGGGGGGESATADPRLAHVANYSDNSVSTYPIDATTGRLKVTGKIVAGTCPASLNAAGAWQ